MRAFPVRLPSGARYWTVLRSTVLFHLAARLPAALLACMLGIRIEVAVAWQRISAGDWMACAAGISRCRNQ